VNRIHWTILVGALAIGWAGTCAAADPAVPETLRACAAIKTDAERHACYDREMAKLLGPDGVAALPVAAAAQVTPEQRFGLSPGQAEARYAKETGAEPLKELSSKVTDVHVLRDDRIVVDLENGQSWQQVDTTANPRVRPGDAVRITHNVFGAYWMEVNGHAARFRRVR
jgi:hypothetical protein